MNAFVTSHGTRSSWTFCANCCLCLIPHYLLLLSKVQFCFYCYYCCFWSSIVVRTVIHFFPHHNSLQTDALTAFFFADKRPQGMRLTQYFDTYWRQFANAPDTPEGRLADLFLTYFSCPVSETSCERVFSLMRNIMTDDRKKVSQENIFCTLQVKLGMKKWKKH